MIRWSLAVIAALAIASPATAEKLKVVATFSVIGDMVHCVAEDRADITTLVGPDADAHAFEPTPAHARAVAEADVVFANGLGFEPWLARLMKSTNTRARLVTVTTGIPHMRADDPHAWQHPGNAETYYGNIRKIFVTLEQDPKTRLAYDESGGVCIVDVESLDKHNREYIGRIPKAHRRVITSHDAFGYLGDAYDIAFLAPLGLSTEAQASAKGVARLIQQIKREKITAVFVENITDPRLIEQIARETGVKIGGKLYSDALSTKAGPAPTYLAMMRHNVKLLTAAMAPAH
jgi:zinc/manganese transport system substrate-binding protein